MKKIQTYFSQAPTGDIKLLQLQSVLQPAFGVEQTDFRTRRLPDMIVLGVNYSIGKTHLGKYYGQDTQPSFTHPNGQYLRGCQSAKSNGTWLAKLLLSLYQKTPE